MAITVPLADFRTIPDADYRKQYAIMVGEIAAAAEDGFTNHEQKRGYLERVIPAWETVRDTDDKDNLRGLLAIRIAEARTTFRDVMGHTWQPTATNTIAAAARARGLHL